MADTRAGFWLLVVVALIAAGMVVLQLFTGQGEGRTFAGIFAGTLMPVSLLLPVLGILSVTSEWSQRTAVTTFTLVPIRWRTTVAKLLAGVALAALSVVVCLAAAALGNLLVGPVVDGAGGWTIEAAAIGTAFVYQLGGMIMGMAFGMLFMNTPTAIVLYFLVPTVWAIMTQFIGALRTAREWLDQSVTMTPLTTGEITGDSWARVGATAGLWVLLPLIIGLARLMRREVS
ncbi:MAG: ABC transporter permease [Streptosporangiaceae bacterium]